MHPSWPGAAELGHDGSLSEQPSVPGDQEWMTAVSTAGRHGSTSPESAGSGHLTARARRGVGLRRRDETQRRRKSLTCTCTRSNASQCPALRRTRHECHPRAQPSDYPPSHAGSACLRRAPARNSRPVSGCRHAGSEPPGFENPASRLRADSPPPTRLTRPGCLSCPDETGKPPGSLHAGRASRTSMDPSASGGPMVSSRVDPFVREPPYSA